MNMRMVVSLFGVMVIMVGICVYKCYGYQWYELIHFIISIIVIMVHNIYQPFQPFFSDMVLYFIYVVHYMSLE